MRDLLISAISGFLGGLLGTWTVALMLRWLWPGGIAKRHPARRRDDNGA